MVDLVWFSLASSSRAFDTGWFEDVRRGQRGREALLLLGTGQWSGREEGRRKEPEETAGGSKVAEGQQPNVNDLNSLRTDEWTVSEDVRGHAVLRRYRRRGVTVQEELKLTRASIEKDPNDDPESHS